MTTETGPAGASDDGDLRSKLALLAYMVGELKSDLKELKDCFATKSEVADLREDVKGIKAGISWAVKIVLGVVLVGVVGLVMVKGGGVPKL